MVQTAKELLEAIKPLDDPEVHAFVEYLEWMKSSDDTDPPLNESSDSHDLHTEIE